MRGCTNRFSARFAMVMCIPPALILNCMGKMLKCIDYLKNTFIEKEINVKISCLKGKNDPAPKKRSYNFKFQYSLLQTVAVAAGALLTVTLASECAQKACEAKVMKKLLSEKECKNELENESDI